MNGVILAFAAICVIGSAAAVIVSRVRMKRTVRRLDDMIDTAIEGKCTESTFDETVMSALESKLWQYVSGAETAARRTAEEKDKIKTLIADISHQTQTPIANIRLYSELLAESGLSTEAADYAAKIDGQSEKLGFLITSLVKLSRLETGIIALSPTRTDAVPMLDDLAGTFGAAAAEKGLTFAADYGDVSAVFDEKWTSEALANILSNAVKYTETGGIRLSAREYEMFVCIEVSDTGIGISEEEQPRIFSRFYRSEAVAQQQGVGIGLYLAREIIAGQNGYIKVSSEEGKGAKFEVFLPK